MKFENFGKNTKKIGLAGFLVTLGVLAPGESKAQSGSISKSQTIENTHKKINESIEYLNSVAVDAPDRKGPPHTGKNSEFIKTPPKVTDAEDIEVNMGWFLGELKKAGVVSQDLTTEEFQKLSEEQMKALGLQYAKATHKLLPEELQKDAVVIKRTSYGMDLSKIKKTDPVKEVTFDFNAWFAEQWQLVKEGKIKVGELVLAPNGKVYAIELNENPEEKTYNKSSSGGNGGSVGGDGNAGQALADGSGDVHFELLKDYKFNKGSSGIDSN